MSPLAGNPSDVRLEGFPLVHFVLRALPLAGFEPVIFGVFWQAKATPIVEAFSQTIQDINPGP